MGARLNKSVLVGGVVYPAGTPATEDLQDRIDAAHWDDADDVTQAEEVPEHPNTALLRSVCEFLVERHLADLDTPVVDLVREALDGFDETPPEPSDEEPKTDGEPAGDPDAPTPDPADPAPVVEQPAGNASRDTWAEYAKAVGATDEDLDGLGQREIRSRWGASTDQG